MTRPIGGKSFKTSKPVQLDEETYSRLKKLSSETGIPMAHIIKIILSYKWKAVTEDILKMEGFLAVMNEEELKE